MLALADLVVAKTGPATVIAGTRLTYTITLTNNGPDPAQDVELQDTAPAGTSIFSLAIPPGFGATVTTTSFTSTASNLASGGSVQFTLVLNTSPSNAEGRTLSNSATATSSTPDPNSGNNSGRANTTVQTQADLVMVKTGPATAVAGTTITYTLTATNNGPSDAQGYVLGDGLSGDATFESGLVQVSGPAFNSPVPVGQSVVYTVEVHIFASAAAASTVQQSASISSITPDPNTNNNSSTASTTVTTSADLVMVKTGPATAIAGTTITYTLTATNNGPSDAQGYFLIDSLSGFASPGNFVQVSGPATGGPLPAGQTAVYTFTAHILASAPNGSILHNTGEVQSLTSDPNGANNSSSIDTTVLTQADLTVAKTASPNPVILGGNITYTINVTNNGPSDARNVVLTDSLPTGTVFLSESQSSGPAFTLGHPNVGVNGTVSNTIVTLAAGASASFQIVVQAQSRALAQTTVVNTATISSTTTDPNTGNNSSTTSTQVFDQADLAVTKAGPPAVFSGNNLTYTLTVTNNGPIFDPNVVLTDAIPTNTTFVAETQTSGPVFSCSTPPVGGTGTITCSIASLAAGASASFVIVVHVNANAPNHGDIVNTARVAGQLFDPNTANNTAVVHTTAVTPTADLAVTGFATPSPFKANGSGPLVYTLTVTNLGPDAAVGVSVFDVIPFQVGFAGETHPLSWSSLHPPPGSPGTVIFSIASLAAGATASFTIVVKAPPLSAGTILLNSAAIQSSTFDPNSANNVVLTTTPVQ